MSETIHASCVAIAGRAVLIAGPSGSGKSDLSARMLDRGAQLVSDDYTCLEAKGGQLLASPPPTIAGRIELRGVGIVSRAHLAGVPVALLVDLGRPPERLPEPQAVHLAGIAIPSIGFTALEASAPIKLEAALHLLGRPCL
ncbi:MAG TPA: HPr kinase/phosphatase C-terminal domain-containing protein [Allosphingosinicella sp.]|nr:HPr kinase/phosphatase C-terminal domain-containing protein [Allosphingosinicella sp.]